MKGFRDGQVLTAWSPKARRVDGCPFELFRGEWKYVFSLSRCLCDISLDMMVEQEGMQGLLDVEETPNALETIATCGVLKMVQLFERPGSGLIFGESHGVVAGGANGCVPALVLRGIVLPALPFGAPLRHPLFFPVHQSGKENLFDSQHMMNVKLVSRLKERTERGSLNPKYSCPTFPAAL